MPSSCPARARLSGCIKLAGIAAIVLVSITLSYRPQEAAGFEHECVDCTPPKQTVPLPTKPSIFPRDFWFVKVEKVAGTTIQGVMNGVCAHHNIEPMACGKPMGDQWEMWKPPYGVELILKHRNLLGHRYLAITEHGRCYVNALIPIPSYININLKEPCPKPKGVPEI